MENLTPNLSAERRRTSKRSNSKLLLLLVEETKSGFSHLVFQDSNRLSLSSNSSNSTISNNTLLSSNSRCISNPNIKHNLPLHSSKEGNSNSQCHLNNSNKFSSPSTTTGSVEEPTEILPNRPMLNNWQIVKCLSRLLMEVSRKRETVSVRTKRGNLQWRKLITCILTISVTTLRTSLTMMAKIQQQVLYKVEALSAKLEDQLLFLG